MLLPVTVAEGETYVEVELDKEDLVELEKKNALLTMRIPLLQIL